MKTDFDALLLVSFGGTEGLDDVIPFLENVLRGRNVPRERMLSVARHYEMFGGVSPINQANRDLIAALKKELEHYGPRLPIYWGNRNWHPLLPDTLRQMADDGVRDVLAFVTSGYSSYSSCRQYREDLAAAQEAVRSTGRTPPRIARIRHFFDPPLHVDVFTRSALAALDSLPAEHRRAAHLVFTA